MTELQIKPEEQIAARIYLAEQVRELDRIAIEEFNIPGFTLMQRAGMAAFDFICQHWPQIENFIIFAGLGNNGGDGYVIAKLALEAGLQVEVVQLGEQSKLQGDAKRAHDEYVQVGGLCSAFNREQLPLLDAAKSIVVDALLGTGLTRQVQGDYADAITFINQQTAPVLSVDIPSGLDANHGMPLGKAVVANVTVTFVGMKLGLLTATGPVYSGKIVFDHLGIPTEVYSSMSAACQKIQLTELHNMLGRRKADAHKGDFGHVLIIGGNYGMAGSVMLAAQAAARTGSGLISVATRKEHASTTFTLCREVMVHAVSQAKDLDTLLKRATVIVIGPGLGQDQWARNLFSRLLQFDLPMVVDADALNLLAKDPMQKQTWVLTPHPGEAARLLNATTKNIQAERLPSAQMLQQQYGGVCVLKGSGTLITDGEHNAICTAGNPGMASGGMGDVLSGIIAALLAQGLSLYDASRFAVQLHAQSADIAAQDGERGMIASDLFLPLRSLVNKKIN